MGLIDEVLNEHFGTTQITLPLQVEVTCTFQHTLDVHTKARKVEGPEGQEQTVLVVDLAMPIPKGPVGSKRPDVVASTTVRTEDEALDWIRRQASALGPALDRTVRRGLEQQGYLTT